MEDKPDGNEAIYATRAVVQLIRAWVKAVANILQQNLCQPALHTDCKIWKIELGSQICYLR